MAGSTRGQGCIKIRRARGAGVWRGSGRQKKKKKDINSPKADDDSKKKDEKKDMGGK